MTKDRIKDLQKTNPWPRVSYKSLSRQLRNHEGENGNNDGGNQLTTIDMDREYNVPEFLAQIDLLRLLIDKIEELAKQVSQIHKKMLEPMADPKLAHELDEKIADIKKLAYDVSTKLKKMEQVQESQEDDDKTSTQWRIKESQIFNTTRRFREVMNQYNQESVLHQDRCKKVIKRELEMTGNRRSDEEIDDMLESGFPGTFNFSIMVDIEKAKLAVSQIEARHRDIQKIETSIRELHSMFLDLAQLVATQGELIDHIEHNVSKTVDFVNLAAVEVKQADALARAARKKKIIICVIITAVILILILIFGAYFTTQRKLFGR